MYSQLPPSPSRASMPPKDLGRWGEDTALALLEQQGYSLLARNWRPSPLAGQPPLRGELDLVMRDNHQAIVFIEVKTRAGTGYGHPFEAITARKSQKLRQLAYAWLAEHQVPYSSMRVDAIALCGSPTRFVYEHRQAVV
ncbi:MAG: YraN family protein [Rothia sp. (in: high G+C Gram-positive bacteria)]|nr:YraN family protein [Rothia sp. (in: high G+C Gram-positive bacteria)]